MSKILVFGHKNPDTDTITSAIVHAYLKQQLGVDAEAVRLGEINGETQFALDKFGFEAPRLVEKVSTETQQVMLVDHNEFQQSADDIRDVTILEVIDHHRIANFETADPLYFRVEPVGCTATILNKLFKEHNIDIPANIAGLMVSAIVSDTLLFKSPTCTEQDVAAAKELAKVAGIDVDEYGLAMLKAGADLSAKKTEDLLTLDAKEFTFGNYKAIVAQVNAVDVNDVLVRQSEVETLGQALIEKEQLGLYFFVITDILNNDSVAIALGEASEAAAAAFQTTLKDNRVVLPGIVSRKKQIVPALTEGLQ